MRDAKDADGTVHRGPKNEALALLRPSSGGWHGGYRNEVLDRLIVHLRVNFNFNFHKVTPVTPVSRPRGVLGNKS